MTEFPFTFDQEATLAALLYVAGRVDGLTMHKLAKILYFADKAHLERYGRFITGDQYVAMENGPVPSMTYSMVKELGNGAPDALFAHPLADTLRVERREGKHYVRGLTQPDLDALSDSDLACLDDSIANYSAHSFRELSDLSHDAAWNATERNKLMRIEAIVSTFAQPEAVLEHLRNPNP